MHISSKVVTFGGIFSYILWKISFKITVDNAFIKKIVFSVTLLTYLFPQIYYIPTGYIMAPVEYVSNSVHKNMLHIM